MILRLTKNYKNHNLYSLKFTKLGPGKYTCAVELKKEYEHLLLLTPLNARGHVALNLFLCTIILKFLTNFLRTENQLKKITTETERVASLLYQLEHFYIAIEFDPITAAPGTEPIIFEAAILDWELTKIRHILTKGDFDYRGSLIFITSAIFNLFNERFIKWRSEFFFNPENKELNIKGVKGITISVLLFISKIRPNISGVTVLKNKRNVNSSYIIKSQNLKSRPNEWLFTVNFIKNYGLVLMLREGPNKGKRYVLQFALQDIILTVFKKFLMKRAQLKNMNALNLTHLYLGLSGIQYISLNILFFNDSNFFLFEHRIDKIQINRLRIAISLMNLGDQGSFDYLLYFVWQNLVSDLFNFIHSNNDKNTICSGIAEISIKIKF